MAADAVVGLPELLAQRDGLVNGGPVVARGDLGMGLEGQSEKHQHKKQTATVEDVARHRLGERLRHDVLLRR
jgi:hypothetical protein